MPFPSVVQNQASTEDGFTDAYIGKNRFGWQKQRERELTPPSKVVDRVPSGREESKVITSSYKDYPESQMTKVNEDYDYYEEKYETPARLSKPKDEVTRKLDTRVKDKNPEDNKFNLLNYDAELDTLLKVRLMQKKTSSFTLQMKDLRV